MEEVAVNCQLRRERAESKGQLSTDERVHLNFCKYIRRSEAFRQ